VIAKVCGITRLTDALHAVNHGATALGFVFWPRSPRCITPGRAAEIIAELPGTITPVGVFVNQPVDQIRHIAAASGVTAIQLHGDEPPAYAEAIAWPIWRAITLENTPALSAVEANGALSAWPDGTLFLLDAHDPERRGGTGRQLDWRAAADVARRKRVVLAGGLTPENVREAIETVRPAGVDVSSGVEEAPGIKDFDKVARFLEHARAALSR
jgi:phosphoribosylanthranilate isomerase